jgi:hypothetical protein
LAAAGFLAADFLGAGYFADEATLPLPALFAALQLAPFALLWLQVASLAPLCVPVQVPSLWRLQLPLLVAVFVLLAGLALGFALLAPAATLPADFA